MSSEFEEFRKIPRLTREAVITEKLDGTNAQVCISEDGSIAFGSRSRWLTIKDDNFGFARWAEDNKDELLKLGVGRHFGEWWGSGIQRGYGLKEKRFSLFNVSKWSDDAVRPACCSVVPVLYQGMFDTNTAIDCLNTLREKGSAASPGFMKPEGIIIYHTQGNLYFKKTLDKDDEYKGKQAA
jgi:RNA ligase-like protein